MDMNTVYIVEDEPGIRLLLKEIMESEQVQVKAFETPIAALENIKQDKPKLLFVDFHLPMMNGIEFIKKAYAEVSCPAIMMSGYDKEELDNEIDTSIVTEWIRKPFEVTDIMTIVQTYLHL